MISAERAREAQREQGAVAAPDAAVLQRADELGDGGRGFNEDYEDLVEHLGMKARTIGVGKREQNGDIEAAHRPLKRRIEQQLLLRGSRDFESVEAYKKWVSATIVRPANRGRAKRFDEELALMGPMRATRLPERRPRRRPSRGVS